MNANHERVCGSPEWAKHLRTDVLPVVTSGHDLGARMLEIGPGPGAATPWLAARVERLVALESDETAARRLADQFAGTNVEVVTGDATAMSYPDATFDSVGMFTMLHHVPTTAQQNQLLAEALRVLRPGGVLIGSDSLASDRLHHFHTEDTYNPVEPASLLVRLQTFGFEHITVMVHSLLMFTATKASTA